MLREFKRALRHMSHDDILFRLRKKLWSEGNIVAFGVSNRLESPHRVCDCMSLRMRVWGIPEFVGYEVKTSRNDWVAETKNPTKSEPFREMCTEWFVVAREGLVRKSELPAGWGLIEISVDDTGLVIFREVLVEGLSTNRPKIISSIPSDVVFQFIEPISREAKSMAIKEASRVR